LISIKNYAKFKLGQTSYLFCKEKILSENITYHRRKNVWEQVVDQIKSLIISGEWKVGQQLPPEIKLAKQFGVSRPTLREAIKQLSLMGLVEVCHGKGTFVTRPNNESFMRPLSLLLMQKKQNILEVVEARLMIENTTASYAAKRVTEAEIQILQTYLSEMIANKQNLEKYIEIDHLFHKQIALAAKNSIMIKMFDIVEDLLNSKQFRKIILPNMKTGVEEHQKILKAILSGDSNKAQSAMNEHLMATLLRRYLTILEKN
jgi:GntR family transcriptional repressor for pyruvate dehydrogenase complex